jgi:hypothetical protein
MELSGLTNKELKSILRENQVKNYSNLHKKELVKKVNQLTREQNGGKSGKGKNCKKKKYTLKDLIGGKEPEELKQHLLSNQNRKKRNDTTLSISRSEPGGYIPPSIKNIPITKNEINKAALQQQQPLSSDPSLNEHKNDVQVATTPPFSQSEQNALTVQEEEKQLNSAKKRSLENQGGIQNTNSGKNECGSMCSIL